MNLAREILEKPLSVGDLIGRAIRVYRLNFKSWVPILVWPTIICALGRVIMQGSMAIAAERESGLSSIGFGILALIGLSIWIVSKWVIIVRQLAFVRLANGFSSSLGEALDFVQKRQWSVLGAAVLVNFILVAVTGLWFLELIASGLLYKRDTILAITASAGLLFGIIAGSISCSFIYYVMFVVCSGIACEKTGMTAMISRGFKLTGKAVFRTLCLGTLIWLTTYFISIPLWLPPFILIGLDAFRMGLDVNLAKDVPIHWQVISSAWEPLVEMVIWPITSLAYGFFYYDLRLRQEAVDVDLKLEVNRQELQTEASFS